MKFNTEGLRRKDFKSDEDYLSAVYDQNPKIQEVYEGLKQTFINKTMAYKVVEKTSITGALRKVANTRDFTPYKELATENALKGIRENFPGALKQITTKVRDAKGHFTKFDRTQFQWDKDLQGYVYMGRILVTLQNSPQRIEIKELSR